MPRGECLLRIERGKWAADEGPIIVQGEEFEVTKESEPHEAIVGDGGPRIVGEKKLDERSEQPVAVAPSDMDGGVRDEDPEIAQGDEAVPSGQLEAIAPDEA
ncbi:hypothetical protein AMTR_s00108p00116970 [Amborella trichopoda]|uniref:Uncharacterized protein n=1 Tax=Amborella trichopoda TaxID=13333 RepID=W1NVQ6_AMBTC|nr:hypothetical protein AMTR_s00108p00116970 [Amborella trichopoda]